MLDKYRQMRPYEKVGTWGFGTIISLMCILVTNQTEWITYSKVTMSYMQNSISKNENSIAVLARELHSHEKRHPYPKESFVPRDLYNKLDQRQVRPKDKLH